MKAASSAARGGTPATVMLDRVGVSYRLHPYTHDSGADSYGDEAAIALGIDPHRIFKTLIAVVDTKLACAVVPVSGHLDLKALAGALGGKKADMAEPAKAQRATGYVVGGISPLGHRTWMPIVIDASALDLESIYVSAGKRGLQVELAPHDLVSVAEAVTGPVAAP